MKRKAIIWGSVILLAAIGGYMYYRGVKKKAAKEFNPEEKEGKKMGEIQEDKAE